MTAEQREHFYYKQMNYKIMFLINIFYTVTKQIVII